MSCPLTPLGQERDTAISGEAGLSARAALLARRPACRTYAGRVPSPSRPAPEPVETDDVRVVALGTGLWAIGLVVALVFREQLVEDGRGDWVWVLAAGVFLGLVGIRHVRRRRAGSDRKD